MAGHLRPPLSPERSHLRGVLGAASRYAPGSESHRAAAEDYRRLMVAERVEELLRDAPPLTEEQLGRLLATLLRRSSTAADCRTGTAS